MFIDADASIQSTQIFNLAFMITDLSFLIGFPLISVENEVFSLTSLSVSLAIVRLPSFSSKFRLLHIVTRVDIHKDYKTYRNKDMKMKSILASRYFNNLPNEKNIAISRSDTLSWVQTELDKIIEFSKRSGLEKDEKYSSIYLEPAHRFN